MVLGEYDKLAERMAVRLPAEGPFPVGRINAVVYIGLAKGILQMADLPEILIIGISFPGDQGVQGMVEFIDPLTVEVITSFVDRVDIAGIIQVDLGDQDLFSTGPFFYIQGQVLEFLHKMTNRKVFNGVDSVQAQSI